MQGLVLRGFGNRARVLLLLIFPLPSLDLSRFRACLLFFFFFFLPSHLFPEFEGRLATPGILPEHLNRGHITRFLSLSPHYVPSTPVCTSSFPNHLPPSSPPSTLQGHLEVASVLLADPNKATLCQVTFRHRLD